MIPQHMVYTKGLCTICSVYQRFMRHKT